MSRNKFAVITSLLLVVLMMFSSCAGQSSGSDSAASAEQSAAGSSEAAASTEASPEAAGEDGPLTPFAETVTVRVAREFNPDIWYPEGESIEKNVLTDFYKEQLNIDYEMVQEIERGQYDAKLNLAIASDDLPDIFYANASQIYRMYTAGQIQDQTDAYEKYATEKVRSELEVNDRMYFAPAMFEGRIYGIPCPEDFSLSVPQVWVRQDWLDDLGITDFEPKTNEDIYELGRKFMAEKGARFGLMLDNGVGNIFSCFNTTMRGLAHSQGYPINIFYDDGSGNLVWSDIQPEMKDVLKDMQSLYNEGMFDKEFAVKEVSKAQEDLAAGYVGIYINPFTVRGPFAKNKQNQPEAEWTGFPIPAQADGSYHVSAESTCFRWLVVGTGYENPEAAIKGQNLWHELWQGDHAEYFHGLNTGEYSQAGEDFKLYPPFWFDPPMKNLRQGEVFPDAWHNRDRDSIESPETRKQYDRSIRYFEEGESDLYTGWTNIHLFDMAFPILKQVYGAPDNILFEAYNGPTTDVIANKRPLADQTRLEWLIKFIVGNADVDAEFDTYVQEWLAVGGQDVLDEANEWYKAR